MLVYLIALMLFLVSTMTSGMLSQMVIVFSGIGLIVALSMQFGYRFFYIERQEKIIEYAERIEIFKRQATDILDSIKVYLIDQFPKHEKEIFKLISEAPKDCTAFMLKFPEIKANETMESMVSSLKEYREKIYKEELDIAELKRENRVVRKTVSLYVFPLLPEDVPEEAEEETTT